MLYFSYGSNMSVTRLRERVPSARFVSVATLYGHDLRFHKIGRDGSGKCDAYETHDQNHRIIGVVYEIEEREKPGLDRKEGVGHGYNEKVVELEVQSGDTIKATTYYATSIGSDLKPYRWYRYHVLTGAMENGLPGEYVEKIEGVESIVDPEPARHEGEMAIYADAADAQRSGSRKPRGNPQEC